MADKLFHMTVWGKDNNAPKGYKFISAHTVTAVDGFHAAHKVAAWKHWGPSVWFSTTANKGRPEVIIRNETPE